MCTGMAVRAHERCELSWWGTGLRAGAQEHRERRGEEREAVWKKETRKKINEKKR